MKSSFGGGGDMIPQIFISSTFYDLKYAREYLGNFIKGYGFAPVLFEKGDVGYLPGQELDLSCYRTMQVSDMSILIVGGRYGSPATGEKMEENKFNEYLSITRREFETAVEACIPIFVFIESSVENEYWLYKKNKEKIESGETSFEFNAVDNINVFRFIDNIRLFRSIPIMTFKEIRDIKRILKKQWADMFKNYLVERRNQVTMQEISPSINEIYLTMQSMEVMLQNVGEKIIGTNTPELEEILEKQNVENIAGKIANSFEFVLLDDNAEQIRNYLMFFVDKFFIAWKEHLLEYPFSDDIEDIKKFYSFFENEIAIISRVKEHLQYENDIFNNGDAYKNEVVKRLMHDDYLRKMKFVN